MPDLVKINHFWTLATNLEFLEGSACTITEAYELLKNMQFHDNPCAIKDYIKKQLSNQSINFTFYFHVAKERMQVAA